MGELPDPDRDKATALSGQAVSGAQGFETRNRQD